jgi:hypothetical protein
MYVLCANSYQSCQNGDHNIGPTAAGVHVVVRRQKPRQQSQPTPGIHFMNLFRQKKFGQTLGQKCFGQSLGQKCFGQSVGQKLFGQSFDQKCFRQSVGQKCFGQSFGQKQQIQSFLT